MYKLDKKCIKCPVRKYALKSVPILRTIYEQNEAILDCLDDFEISIFKLQELNREVMFDNANS